MPRTSYALKMRVRSTAPRFYPSVTGVLPAELSLRNEVQDHLQGDPKTILLPPPLLAGVAGPKVDARPLKAHGDVHEVQRPTSGTLPLLFVLNGHNRLIFGGYAVGEYSPAEVSLHRPKSKPSMVTKGYRTYLVISWAPA